jgi:CheY-like chemotaxis protein
VGDPVRIRQVLLNLAGNAVKFTESGGITLELTATDPPVGVRFAVVDTGCGIPEAQRHRLFQAFSQLDASTTRKHGGTGLGLVISHGLVHGMGGTLEVDSTPGAGSTFVAWLPLAAASEGEPDPRTVRGERPGPVRVPLESTWERVVVVDPWPDNRRAVRGLLAPTSIELREVASPRSLRREDHIPSAHTLILIRSEDRTALEETLADLDLEVTTVVTVTTGIPERLGAHPAMRRVVRPLRRASLERLFRDESTEEVVSTEPRRAPGTRGHVLVVEDNVVNQKLALMVLKRAGFTSSVAVNGREALDRLRAADEPFDAVIMDCQMPVMDGFEATGHIREGEVGTGSHLPILAMTANSTPEDRQRCLDAGMDDYLTKPFRPDALIEVLERIVGRAAA